jgi:uncharacterized protein YjiS (DUF1127 family)
MMDERVQHRDYRPFFLDHPEHERRRAARRPKTSFDRAAQRGSRSSVLSDVRLTGRARHRAQTLHIVVLTVLGRIAAAIRRWRWRTRSRQELRELDDLLLRDIGLRREDVSYEFPKPFRHWD